MTDMNDISPCITSNFGVKGRVELYGLSQLFASGLEVFLVSDLRAFLILK